MGGMPSGPATSMKPDELQEHIFATYVGLRYGLAAIGIALPALLWGIGELHGVERQGSMSAYYWASLPGSAPPSRDWFVGGLFAVAACLYLYKGFTKPENVALNLAAVFGVGVAVFPTEWNCGESCRRFTVHGTSAFLLFLCLFYVVWFRARDTLSLLPETSVPRYRMLYRTIGLVMLASPLTALVVNWLTGGMSYIFFVEAAGIWAFGTYWIVKSRELAASKAARRALEGSLEMAPGGEAREVPARRSLAS